jgi:hypothetical protein
LRIVTAPDRQITIYRWSTYYKTAFRSLGVGLAGSRAMTILVDDLVPDELWAIVEPLLPTVGRPGAAGRAFGPT